jgi:uncharacterized protein with GYD domain
MTRKRLPLEGKLLKEEVVMPIYLLLTTLTDEGRKTIRDNPDRIKEVNQEVERMGIKILSQYALLGPYDFVNIIEAPNNEIVAKLSVELSARGTVQTMSLAAMTLSDFIATLKKKPTQAPW